MKAKTIALAILAVLLVACDGSGQSPEAPESLTPTIGQGSYSQKYTVDTYTTITLDGLKPDSMYGIIVTDSSSRAAEARSTSSILTPMGKDCYLYWSGNDGETSISFSGAELGLTGQAAVKFIKYEPSEDGEYAINTRTDSPKAVYDDGSRLFEEFYRIPTSELKAAGNDLSKIILLENDKHFREGGGSTSMSTDAGVVIDGELASLHDHSLRGLIDISGEDYLYVYNNVEIREGDIIREIIPTTPTEVSAEGVALSAPKAYLVNDAAGDEMVLELDLGDSDIEDYDFFNNWIYARIASGDDAGIRHPAVVPIDYEPATDTALIYLGAVNDDLVLDFITPYGEPVTGESISYREITEEERKRINFVDVDGYIDNGRSFEINVAAGDWFVPIIFTSDGNGRKNLYVDMANTIGCDHINLGYSNDNGVSYAQIGVGPGYDRDELYRNWLECGSLRVRDGVDNDGRVLLRFSKSAQFDPFGDQIEIDCSWLSNKLNAKTEVKTFDSVLLTGLEPGTLYGMRVEGGRWSNSIGRRMVDEFSVFVAEDSNLSIAWNDFSADGDVSIQLVKFDVHDIPSGEIQLDGGLFTDSDGYGIHINAYTLPSSSGQRALVASLNGGGSDIWRNNFYIVSSFGDVENYGEGSLLPQDQGDVTLIHLVQMKGTATVSYDLLEAIPVDDAESITGAAMVEVDASDDERLLLVSTSEQKLDSDNFTEAFYENGDHFFGLICIGEVSERTYGVYVAPCDEPVYILIRDYSGIESVSFGEYESKYHPTEVDSTQETVTLTIPESGYLPIIFTGTEGERDGIESVGISGTYKAFLRLYCGHLDSPSSYGRYSARADNPARFDSDAVLQHGYIEDEPGSVTLTFTRY